ncbi:MAG: hypothetical protein GY941_13450 [Planctomycetes bacterium]|nr:hypothetical protein [Planctomycetota bacterium]
MMATDFNGVGEISTDLKSYSDAIFTAEALPNNTSKLSSAFTLGQTLAGCEVKVICETATTVAAGGVLVELQTSATSDGTYVTQVSKTVPAGAIVAGDFLAGLILPKELNDQLFTKVKLTTTATQATGKVDAYIVRVPK